MSGHASNGVPFTVEAESSLSLAITSPLDGAVVEAGQTLTVMVASPENVQFALVGVMGEDPIGMSDVATSVPAQFSFAIPLNMAPRKYLLSAEATTASGQQGSATILIDVERPDLPLGISTPLPQIVFEAQGEDAPIKIQGCFADDTVLDVTESSKVVYASSDSAVAAVDVDGACDGDCARATRTSRPHTDRPIRVFASRWRSSCRVRCSRCPLSRSTSATRPSAPSRDGR